MHVNYFQFNVEKLRLRVANSSLFMIKALCEEHPFAAQHSSPSHGSTLVRNYLLWQGWVSSDKILRGLTSLSFGFDLQGLSDWALSVPTFITNTDPQVTCIPLTKNRVTVMTWKLRTGSKLKHVKQSKLGYLKKLHSKIKYFIACKRPFCYSLWRMPVFFHAEQHCWN